MKLFSFSFFPKALASCFNLISHKLTWVKNSIKLFYHDSFVICFNRGWTYILLLLYFLRIIWDNVLYIFFQKIFGVIFTLVKIKNPISILIWTMWNLYLSFEGNLHFFFNIKSLYHVRTWHAIKSYFM